MPQLPMVEGHYQHFHDSILGALRDFNSADLCRRKGFRGGPLLDFRGSMQLLDSSHVRDRDKALLRAILSGGAWNGFLLGKVCEEKTFHVVFVGVRMEMVTCFGSVLSPPPLVGIRESPEFHDILRLDKAGWPRCLLWHGWLPALSGADDGDPWAVDAADVASKRLEVALGSYVGGERAPGGEFSLAEGDAPLVDAPDVWSDGSLVLDSCSGIGVAGCCVYAHASGAAWFGRMWGHLDLLLPLPDGAGEACRLYCSVPGPLQTVQRGEIWGVLVALQGCIQMHVGVDNLNVVRHVSRIIDGRCTSKPFSPVNDGDLLLQIQQLVFWLGVANAAVSKVKGHADEGLVALGRVCEVDRLGNNEADAAAALGRRRVHHAVAYARRMVSRSCAHWYPIVRELHRFFIAIARSVLNDDGMSGTALHPVVWSAAANPRRRKVEQGSGNLATLPGPAHLWISDWYQLPVACIGEGDMAAWPFSVGLLLKFVHFLR